MKLVDILARELKVWPEGCDELFQTSSGRVIGISNSNKEKSEKIGHFTLNDEGTDPHVTRAEWQASRECLVIDPEWPDHYSYTNPDCAGAAILDCRSAFNFSARAAGVKTK